MVFAHPAASSQHSDRFLAWGCSSNGHHVPPQAMETRCAACLAVVLLMTSSSVILHLPTCPVARLSRQDALRDVNPEQTLSIRQHWASQSPANIGNCTIHAWMDELTGELPLLENALVVFLAGSQNVGSQAVRGYQTSSGLMAETGGMSWKVKIAACNCEALGPEVANLACHSPVVFVHVKHHCLCEADSTWTLTSQ